MRLHQVLWALMISTTYHSHDGPATLTWTLIEICKQTHLQDRLRAEILAAFPHSDPGFDDFTNGLPLLDAIVHETLRLHPALVEAWRHVSCSLVLPAKLRSSTIAYQGRRPPACNTDSVTKRTKDR
jgi:hypothetical protein